MSGAPSFATAILKSKGLKNFFLPMAKTYARLAGYRQMGLKYDDLIPEENDHMQKALHRLTPRESYDRAYRIRLAQQCSMSHTLLPQDKWVKDSEDTRYVTPIAEEILREDMERDDFDALKVNKK